MTATVTTAYVVDLTRGVQPWLATRATSIPAAADVTVRLPLASLDDGVTTASNVAAIAHFVSAAATVNVEGLDPLLSAFAAALTAAL